MGKLKSLVYSWKIVIIPFLIAITFSYAMFQGNFVSWFLFYTLIPFFLYAIILSFVPIKIVNIQRNITPSRLVRGKNGQVTIRFEVKSWLPLIYLSIQEIGVGNFTNEKSIFFVGWKRRFEWSYEIQNLQRGIYYFEGLQFEFHDFFGWIKRNKIVYIPESIIVYPNVFPINYKPVQYKNEHGGNAFQFSLIKDTSLVTGVRNYQSGDRFSRIHWKSFAKDETLRTKEFEDRKSEKLFIILDRSVEKYFDDVVDFAASIIQTVTKYHGEISFLSVGKSRFYEPKIKTAVQAEKVLEHLALVQPDNEYSLDSVFLKEEQYVKGSLVFVITGFLSEQVKSFFIKQNMASIICFVVGNREDYETMKSSALDFPQVKFIPITREMFQHAFTEVLIP